MNSTDKLVADASVAVKWHVDEDDSDKANALLGRYRDIIAPDLLAIEVGNIFRNKVRRGLLTPLQADQSLTTFLQDRTVRFLPSGPHLNSALQIANAYNLSIYDALYVAIADAENCQFVTADDRPFNSLQNTRIAPHIVRLAGLPG